MGIFRRSVDKLAESGDVAGLIRALKARVPGNPDAELRASRAGKRRLAAAKALAGVRHSDAVEALIAAVVYDDQPAAFDEETGSESGVAIQRAAVRSLMALDPLGTNVLVDQFTLLTQPENLKDGGLFGAPLTNVVFAIGELRHQPSLTPLRSLLEIVQAAERQANTDAAVHHDFHGASFEAGFYARLLRTRIEDAIAKIEGAAGAVEAPERE